MSSAARKKPKIWMNVTTSANWNRPVVGIVRVEKEICRELASIYGPDEFGLCVFEGNEFVPFRGKGRLPKRDEGHPLIWPERSRRVPLSSTFDPVLGAAKRGLVRKVLPETVVSTRGENSSMQLGYGDIIVSVGLDWDYPHVGAFQSLKNDMGIRFLTCCYDLIPILLPHYCVEQVAGKFGDYFTKISWLSSTILCISQRSRDDYRDFARGVGAPEVDTVVIPLGDNVPKSGVGKGAQATFSAEVQRVVAGPFILFVSTIERRKNHEVLYRAYHLLAREGHGAKLPKMVFVGMAGWGVADLLKDIELDPLTKGLIVQLNHVSDDELGYLYEKAQFCVYPSLYEGWGLPVGEALACGKAVIASGEGSIPEVGGDLVTYLDPWNPQAWADEILRLVEQPERLKAMEEAVRKDYRARTWRDTAEVVRCALDKLREPRDIAVTLYPGYDLYTLVGTPCAQAIHSTGTAGSLAHGPYRSLPPGIYDIAITLDKLEGATGTVHCRMLSGQGGNEHGAVKISFDEREHFGLVATITGVQLDTPVNDYEISIEVTENLLVAANKIEIKSSSGDDVLV